MGIKDASDGRVQEDIKAEGPRIRNYVFPAGDGGKKKKYSWFDLICVFNCPEQLNKWPCNSQCVIMKMMTFTTIVTIIDNSNKDNPETCDIWDTDNNTDNWEPEIMTIFVIWQLIVTLDSIRNSCDVWAHTGP